MYTPQTIVIIGAGEIGKGITRGLSNGHDRVILCDNDFEATESFTKKLQAQQPAYKVEALECSYEATWEADIIILALSSCPDRQEIAKKIQAVANQKIVIVADDAREELQQLLPHTKIIQAFTNIDPAAFDAAPESKKTIHCLVRGDDEEAVQAAAALVKTIGFHPVATLIKSSNSTTPA